MSLTTGLTLSILKSVLSYDDQTGIFRWIKKTCRKVVVGEVAGCLIKNGYARIRINGTCYYAHRLAWFYVHGEMPSNVIDHINGNPSDNRISNLRDASNFVNAQNKRKPREGSNFAFAGVSKNGLFGYMARIHTRGETSYLGTFKTPELAHSAYINAKRQIHEGCTV